METKTLKEFWISLKSTDRDELRRELAEATLVADSTVNAYGYGHRSVPVRKQAIVCNIIKRRYQINITFKNLRS